MVKEISKNIYLCVPQSACLCKPSGTQQCLLKALC